MFSSRHRPPSMKNFQVKPDYRWQSYRGLESILQRELYGPRRHTRLRKNVLTQWLGSPASEEELIDRHTKIRPVEQIKELSSKLEVLPFGELEYLIESQVNCSDLWRAEQIASSTYSQSSFRGNSVRKITISIGVERY